MKLSKLLKERARRLSCCVELKTRIAKRLAVYVLAGKRDFITSPGHEKRHLTRTNCDI